MNYSKILILSIALYTIATFGMEPSNKNNNNSRQLKLDYAIPKSSKAFVSDETDSDDEHVIEMQHLEKKTFGTYKKEFSQKDLVLTDIVLVIKDKKLRKDLENLKFLRVKKFFETTDTQQLIDIEKARQFEDLVHTLEKSQEVAIEIIPRNFKYKHYAMKLNDYMIRLKALSPAGNLYIESMLQNEYIQSLIADQSKPCAKIKDGNTINIKQWIKSKQKLKAQAKSHADSMCYCTIAGTAATASVGILLFLLGFYNYI